MTTVLDSNVHNIAVKGTFDDCQVSLSTLLRWINSNVSCLVGYCEGALRGS